MTHWIRELAAKPGDLNLLSRTHMVGEPTPTSYPLTTTCLLWPVSPSRPLQKREQVRCMGFLRCGGCREQMLPSLLHRVTAGCVNGRAEERVTGPNEGSCGSWHGTTMVGLFQAWRRNRLQAKAGASALGVGRSSLVMIPQPHNSPVEDPMRSEGRSPTMAGCESAGHCLDS